MGDERHGESPVCGQPVLERQAVTIFLGGEGAGVTVVLSLVRGPEVPLAGSPSKGAHSKGGVMPQTAHSKRPQFNVHARLGESWGRYISQRFQYYNDYLTPSDTAEHLERLTDLMLALGIDVVLALNTKAGHLLWNK